MKQLRQPDIAVLIVAAGRGERAGASHEGPKQYRKIGGQAVISRTISAFRMAIPGARIVCVIHPDDKTLFNQAIGAENASAVETVMGGATRQDSVRLGLHHLSASPPQIILIHDAVRPFFSAALVERVLASLATGVPGALPVLAVTDTLKEGRDGRVMKTVPRANLFAAQTPQGFSFAAIHAAHEKAAAAGLGDFTDDASLLEWTGERVDLVEGEADNIKLTLKRDIDMARERFNARMTPDIRTGNGYDVHKLVEGNGVTLCGVFIPHDHKLSGHSDADVAYHALTDALLATCGAGDIGDHFPPSDPQWKGAASRIFLRHAAKIVADHGGTILNADVSLIAEAPKIGPHRLAMRQNMVDVLGIALERCSVKATTNETIGFVGRREGIAAIATASVAYGGPDDAQ